MLIQHKMSKKQKPVPQEDDKKCQIANMWPVKPQMDVWSKKPAVKSSNKK